MHIGLLLIDGFALMSYSAVVEPLRAANLLADKPLYHLRHIAACGSCALSSGGVSFQASARVGTHMDFDFVFVFAGGDPGAFYELKVFHWLRELARRGVVLVGISGGPVILAAAGLLDNYRMTVHWEHAETLAKTSPHLLMERTIYVIDRNRISCAGGIAPLDLMHMLISTHHGSDFAQKVSDWFMHTDIRPSGGPQRAGIADRYHTTNLGIVLAIEAMENHIADPLSLPQLALLSGVGPRQLNRQFQSKLNQSTMGFYRDLRLEKGREFLTRSSLSILQIAHMTGFSSSTHFSQCFRKKYGLTPSELRS